MYIRPQAKGPELLLVSRIAVGVFGLTAGGLCCMLYAVRPTLCCYMLAKLQPLSACRASDAMWLFPECLSWPAKLLKQAAA